MAEPNSDVTQKDSTPNTEVVTTRVNVAFPFSRLEVQEPTKELAALAALVRDMADLLTDSAPGPTAQELAKRAHALASRLT
jgi:hypothetical protein